ncbi:MAG: hypothetical protein ACLSVD_07615 [Eggerthellaceae bacterium]
MWACRPPYGEVDDLLFCWEAHRIALGGCDMLLLANASNRFAAFACMQPGEWRDWGARRCRRCARRWRHAASPRVRSTRTCSSAGFRS